MDRNYIADDELLYRAIVGPQHELIVNGSPTEGVFMDEKGLSVERDGDRCEEKVISELRYRFRNSPYYAAVRIGAGECRSDGAYPVAVGNKKNKFHAEIHESKTCVPVSVLTAMKLASHAKLV